MSESGQKPFFSCGFADVLTAALAAVISFFVYLKTLAPTVTGEDSGELIAAAYSLGIPHPPGYPLWTLLGKLFSLLPVGDVAFRINLMSAFFASLTVFLIVLIAGKITGSRIAAFVASLAFGFSKTFWSQTVIAEVYTLNAFFLALLIFLLITWRDAKESQQPFYLYLILIIFSLSLANHYPLMLIALPGFLLYVYSNKKPQVMEFLKKPFSSSRTLLKLLFAFLLVALPCAFFYIHEMYRARGNPLFNWNNPSTPARLLEHISRSDYKSLDLGKPFSPSDVLSFIFNYLGELGAQFTLFLLPIALIGGPVLFSRKKSIAWSLLVIFLLSSFGLIFVLRYSFDRENIMRVTPYYIPSYLVASIFLAAGLLWIIEIIGRRVKRLKLSPLYGAILCAVLLLPLPVIPLHANYAFNDLSRNYISYDYASSLLKSLPGNAILFPSGDNNTFPIAYLQVVEKLRPDVLNGNITGEPSPAAFKIYSALPEAKKPVTKKEIETALITSSKRPVYYLFRGDIPPGFLIHPEGLAYRVCRSDDPNREEAHISLDSITLRGGEKVLPFHSDMDLSLMASLCQMRGEALFQQGKYEEGVQEFRRGADIASHLGEWLNNLGSTCAEAGFPDLAEEFYRRSLSADPRYRTASLNLVKLFKSERSFEAALAQLDAHLGLFPEDQEALATKDEISQFLTESDQLISNLEEEVKKNPDDKTLHNDLGTTYAQRGLYEAAKNEYQKALKLDPLYDVARRNLQRIEQVESKKSKSSVPSGHNVAR